MGWFRKKTKPEIQDYDRLRWEPALRCSICTGEQTAGFREKGTGVFREVMLIRSEDDLRVFMDTYGLTAPPKKFY